MIAILWQKAGALRLVAVNDVSVPGRSFMAGHCLMWGALKIRMERVRCIAHCLVREQVVSCNSSGKINEIGRAESQGGLPSLDVACSGYYTGHEIVWRGRRLGS